MRIRALAPAVALLLLLAGCGDDGGGGGTSTTTTVASAQPVPTTVAGPTEGQAACAGLAHRYVRVVRVLFDRDGAPTDAQVDLARSRQEHLDQIAGAAGCGQGYTDEVCAGLDDLTHEGVLVILPMLTAQCL